MQSFGVCALIETYTVNILILKPRLASFFRKGGYSDKYGNFFLVKPRTVPVLNIDC